MALPTLLPVTKARSNARGAGRSLAFKTRWRMCFSGFGTSRSRSFVFMQTFSLVDRQNTYSCKNDLLANFSVVYIFPCMHSEWRYSLVFISVSSSRRCWSLDLVQMCLFVMSIFTPPFFVVFFFHIAFPRVFFSSCFGLRMISAV